MPQLGPRMHPRVSQSVAPPTSKAGKQNNQDTWEMVVSSWEYQLWSISGWTGTITALKFEFWLVLAPGLLVSLSCAESVSWPSWRFVKSPISFQLNPFSQKMARDGFYNFAVTPVRVTPREVSKSFFFFLKLCSHNDNPWVFDKYLKYHFFTLKLDVLIQGLKWFYQAVFYWQLAAGRGSRA